MGRHRQDRQLGLVHQGGGGGGLAAAAARREARRRVSSARMRPPTCRIAVCCRAPRAPPFPRRLLCKHARASTRADPALDRAMAAPRTAEGYPGHKQVRENGQRRACRPARGGARHAHVRSAIVAAAGVARAPPRAQDAPRPHAGLRAGGARARARVCMRVRARVPYTAYERAWARAGGGSGGGARAFAERSRAWRVRSSGSTPAAAMASRAATTWAGSSRRRPACSDTGDVMRRGGDPGGTAQVDEVKNIMVENIEKVLERGEKLEVLQDKTDDLRFQVRRCGATGGRVHSGRSAVG